MSLDHILLGLLEQPTSGYDLKAVFEQSIAHFWPAQLTQIYRTLNRLEARGLLKCRTFSSQKGPPRKVYTRTAAGRKALQAWVEEEPQVGDERFTYLAQLFFMAESAHWETSLRFVTRMREIFSGRLQALQQIASEQFRDAGDGGRRLSDERFHQYLTLQMGLCTMAARLQWCDRTIDHMKRRIGRESTGRMARGRTRK